MRALYGRTLLFTCVYTSCVQRKNVRIINYNECQVILLEFKDGHYYM